MPLNTPNKPHDPQKCTLELEKIQTRIFHVLESRGNEPFCENFVKSGKFLWNSKPTNNVCTT